MQAPVSNTHNSMWLLCTTSTCTAVPSGGSSSPSPQPYTFTPRSLIALTRSCVFRSYSMGKQQHWYAYRRRHGLKNHALAIPCIWWRRAVM
jgi:hypothetical protein